MWGYSSPAVKNPQPLSRVTPLGTEFLIMHSSPCLCCAAPVQHPVSACPEGCLDLACPSWEHQGWRSGQISPLPTEHSKCTEKRVSCSPCLSPGAAAITVQLRSNVAVCLAACLLLVPLGAMRRDQRGRSNSRDPLKPSEEEME